MSEQAVGSGAGTNENARNPKVSGVSFYDDLAVQSDIESPALPSDQLPTFVGSKSFRVAVDQLPTSVGYCIHRLCRRPTADFRRRSIISGAQRTNFQLPSDIAFSGSAFESASNFHRILHPPAWPSNQLPILHRILHLPASPSDQPPTFIGYRTFQFCLPTKFRLSSVIGSLSLSWINLRPSSDIASSTLSAMNLQFLSEFESSGGAVDQLPTCVSN